MKLLPLEDWKESASQKDGITLQIETKLRCEMYNFARELESFLKNREHSNFQHYFQKALSIYHRFTHQVSFRNFDRYIYMVASLFLAAKDEDMFNWSLDRYVHNFLLYCANRKDQKIPTNLQLVSPSELPKPQKPPESNAFPPDLVKTYQEKVCDAESYILKMLGYDLDIVVPQVYFVEARKRLKLVSGDSEKFWDTAQKYLSDLFITTIALYYQPKIICMAAIYLTQQFMKVQVEDIDGVPWFQLFDTMQQQQVQQQQVEQPHSNFQITSLDDIVAIQKHFEDNIKIIKY